MTVAIKNWPLSAYTNNTWTDLVAEAATVASLIMSNTSGTDAVVQIRLADTTPDNLAAILPPYTVAAGESEILDLRSINVLATQKLQIQVDIGGVEFLGSGVAVS